eukprot:2716997-Amphidinium_carterae.3
MACFPKAKGDSVPQITRDRSRTLQYPASPKDILARGNRGLWGLRPWSSSLQARDWAMHLCVGDGCSHGRRDQFIDPLGARLVRLSQPCGESDLHVVEGGRGSIHATTGPSVEEAALAPLASSE